MVTLAKPGMPWHALERDPGHCGSNYRGEVTPFAFDSRPRVPMRASVCQTRRNTTITTDITPRRNTCAIGPSSAALHWSLAPNARASRRTGSGAACPRRRCHRRQSRGTD
jgi:hypothetical protein